MHKWLPRITLGAVITLVAVLAIHDTVTAPRAHITSDASVRSSSPPAFDTHAYSTTDPTSIWVIVNKQHPLDPRTYVPASLVVPSIPLRSNITGTEKYVSSAMATALESMATAAKKDGVTLNLQSGYRSYDFQVALYNSYVKNDGQAAADRESARPGYSEHQTGLAADLGGVSNPSCNVAQCFDATPEGKWLAAHAYEYGFIIRYPKDKESITGYEYEPWHVRYIGTKLSLEMQQHHVETLEEFFAVTGGTTYAN